MNRFTRESSLAKVALFALAGALATQSGCVIGGEEDWSLGAASSEISTSGGRYTFCSSMRGELRGLEVTVYTMRDDWSLVVVQRHGQVLCVDQPQGVREVGVIPVEDSGEPACSFCQGTPLPASVILADDPEEQ